MGAEDLSPAYVQDLIYEGAKKINDTYHPLFETDLVKQPAHPGKIAISQLVIRGTKDLVRSWLQGVLGSQLLPGFSTFIQGFELEVIGKLRTGVLLDVQVLTATQFLTSSPSASAMAAAAVKMEVFGAKTLWQICMCRDTQYWELFSYARSEDSERIAAAALARLPIHPAWQRYDKAPGTMALKKGVEDYLDALKLEPNHRMTKCISPSEMSISSCDRRVAYSILGEPSMESISNKLRRTFDVGHVHHAVLQASLVAVIDDFIPEPLAEIEAYKIKGNADGYVVSWRRGFELKSISSAGANLSSPKGDHEKQATTYGVALGLEGMYYVYVNKNDGTLVVMYRPIDEAKWSAIAQRAASIAKTVGEGKLPPAYTDREGTCKSCKYVYSCRPNLVGSAKGAFSI